MISQVLPLLPPPTSPISPHPFMHAWLARHVDFLQHHEVGTKGAARKNNIASHYHIQCVSPSNPSFPTLIPRPQTRHPPRSSQPLPRSARHRRRLLLPLPRAPQRSLLSNRPTRRPDLGSRSPDLVPLHRLRTRASHLPRRPRNERTTVHARRTTARRRLDSGESRAEAVPRFRSLVLPPLRPSTLTDVSARLRAKGSGERCGCSVAGISDEERGGSI